MHRQALFQASLKGSAGTMLPALNRNTPQHERASLKAIRARAAILEGSSFPAEQNVSSEREFRSAPAEAVDPPQGSGARESMEDYESLKAQLLQRAKRAGGFLAAYLFLQQGVLAAACSVTGSAAGYLYLLLLVRNVDAYSCTTEVPLLRAQQIASQPMRAIALALSAYRQALRPRLLVPISLAAAVSAFNKYSDHPISNLQEFDMLLGFLCYKAGLLLTLYDDLKPKFDPSALDRPVRPTLPILPDAEEVEGGPGKSQ